MTVVFDTSNSLQLDINMVKLGRMNWILKHKQTLNKAVASLLFVATIATGYSGFVPAAGQSADDLVRQKQEIQKRLDEINKKINDFTNEIKQRKSLANTLANEIAILNLEISQTEAQIQATNDEIQVTNLEIADVTNHIVETEKNIAHNKEILKQLISQIHDLDSLSPLEIALENDNFTEFLDQLQYTTSVQE